MLRTQVGRQATLILTLHDCSEVGCGGVGYWACQERKDGASWYSGGRSRKQIDSDKVRLLFAGSCRIVEHAPLNLWNSLHDCNHHRRIRYGNWSHPLAQSAFTLHYIVLQESCVGRITSQLSQRRGYEFIGCHSICCRMLLHEPGQMTPVQGRLLPEGFVGNSWSCVG